MKLLKIVYIVVFSLLLMSCNNTETDDEVNILEFTYTVEETDDELNFTFNFVISNPTKKEQYVTLFYQDFVRHNQKYYYPPTIVNPDSTNHTTMEISVEKSGKITSELVKNLKTKEISPIKGIIIGENFIPPSS